MRRGLCFIAAAAIAFSIAAPVSAGPTKTSGPFAYVTSTGTVGPSVDESISASCPTGYQLTGGGGGIAGAPDGTVRIASADRQPSSKTTFSTGVRNDSATQRAMSATAICLRGAAASLLDYETDNWSSSSTGSHRDDASCFGSNVIVGGGAFVPPPYTPIDLEAAHPIIDPLFPTEQDWEMKIYSTTSATTSYRNDVICLPPTAAHVRSVRKEVVLDGLTGKTVKVACPRGFRVSGGGFDGNAPEIIGSVSEPYDAGDANKAPDDGWLVRAFDPLSDPTVLAAHAVCVR